MNPVADGMSRRSKGPGLWPGYSLNKQCCCSHVAVRRLRSPERPTGPWLQQDLEIVGIVALFQVSVPRSAVLSTGERNLVFVRGPKGDLEPREVSIGFSTNARTEILKGVKDGDTVVASATFLIDAESNLGSALGGMGEMPGMDVSTPPKKKE